MLFSYFSRPLFPTAAGSRFTPAFIPVRLCSRVQTLAAFYACMPSVGSVLRPSYSGATLFPCADLSRVLRLHAFSRVRFTPAFIPVRLCSRVQTLAAFYACMPSVGCVLRPSYSGTTLFSCADLSRVLRLHAFSRVRFTPAFIPVRLCSRVQRPAPLPASPYLVRLPDSDTHLPIRLFMLHFLTVRPQAASCTLLAFTQKMF